MNSLLLHRLVKVVPYAATAFTVLLMAHGVFGAHAVHVHASGDPGGPGEPNLHMTTNGDPGGPGEPN
jgi:hypothetical protein